MIKLHNQITFSQAIEAAILSGESLTYLEAVCEYCKTTGIEMDSVPKLITPHIKSKIEQEAIQLNFIKSKTPKKKLPFIKG